MEQLTMSVIAETPEITSDTCRNKLVCGFCFDVYRDPRILPCGHTFCLKCLKKQVDSSDKSVRLTCGLCRQPWTLPDDGVSSLPKNFALNDHSSDEPESPIRSCLMTGDGDKHGDVEYSCVDCTDALCVSCFDGHRRTKLTKSHVVLPISEAGVFSELGQGQGSGKIQETDLHLPACAAHPDHHVTQYCTQCDDVICTKCIVTSPTHAKWHKCVEFKDADKTFVLKIGRLLADMRQEVKVIGTSLKITAKTASNLQDEQAKLSRDIESVVSEIRSCLQDTFERCLKTLDTCKSRALADISQLADVEKSRLDTEQKVGSDRVNKLQNIISLSESTLTPYTSTSDRWKLAHKLSSVAKETSVNKRGEDANNNNNSNSKLHFPDVTRWKSELNKWQEGIVQALSRATPPLLTPVLTPGTSGTPGTPGSSSTPVKQHQAPIPPHTPVVAAILTKVIQLPQLKVCNRAVDVLSILNDSLLVSDYMAPELFIYSLHESLQRAVTVPGKMRDAVWLPTGNIICTTGNNRKVTTLTKSGDVISDAVMTDPHRLSVADDSEQSVHVYLADSENGVYESRDCGVTWTLLFKLPDFAWRCWQVIKIRKDEGDVFWCLEAKNGDCRLREYQLSNNAGTNSPSRDSHVTWRDISTSPSPGVDLDLHYAHLAYDGAGNVFLSDFNSSTVHVFSTSGQHERQLLSVRDGLDGPRSLAVDCSQKLLCVGQRKGEVKVFTLNDGRDVRRQSMRPSLSAQSMSDTCQSLPSANAMMRRQSSTPADFSADALASLVARQRPSFDVGSPTSPSSLTSFMTSLSKRPSFNDFVPTSLARSPTSPLARRGSLLLSSDVTNDERPASPRDGASNVRFNLN